MKKFNAGDLSKKPTEVWAAARDGGAIIQHKDRSGKNVTEEFVILPFADGVLTLNRDNGDGELFTVNGHLLGKG